MALTYISVPAAAAPPKREWSQKKGPAWNSSTT